MLKTDTINELIGVDDSWKAPEKLISNNVSINSQLYKQAGNSVTVPVIYEIAKRMNQED
ncbi:DNA cytosine methyltransferase [Companilactobacillus ginsenosidimutans]|uniref:DNA cytosine methyltransferase n=1 Tax=Companilactobacillus ginsenosidimutans TaxID=1007676 RepID=UPI000B15D440